MNEGKLAVLFGGGGFLGHYVAEQLLDAGMRVRIAERDPSNAMSIKALGRLGQTQFVAASVTHAESVAQAVKGADVVVNLVGVFGSHADHVNGTGAGNVARAAAEAGASALVHISAIGADAESPSAYGRSKAAGEAAVRAAFPHATILRPSIIFGREDQFINRFANLIRMLPIVPVIGAQTKFQPVAASDVAHAVRAAAERPDLYGGRTFELGGPDILSMLDLNRWIAEQTGRPRAFVEVPRPVAALLATGLGWAPGAPITSDQLKMLDKDNVVHDGVGTLADLGITPAPLASAARAWLTSYRKHGRFAKRAA